MHPRSIIIDWADSPKTDQLLNQFQGNGIAFTFMQKFEPGRIVLVLFFEKFYIQNECNWLVSDNYKKMQIEWFCLKPEPSVSHVYNSVQDNTFA